MGVGKLMVSTTACRVGEGTGVGTTASLVELQAAKINNPNKSLNTNINVFVMPRYQPLTDTSTNKTAHMSSTIKNIIASKYRGSR